MTIPGPYKRRKRAHPEADHQRALFRWVELAQRRIPELRWLFHCPNGEARDKRTGAQLKAMGVRRGVPDLWLPVPSEYRGTAYCGLVIELKAPPATKATLEQTAWLNHLARCGWVARTCVGWEQARDLICDYLGVSR